MSDTTTTARRRRTGSDIVALSLLGALALPSLAHAQPDLVVRLDTPRTARPGSDIGGSVTIVVYNRGERTAPGTESRGGDGYMVDLFLTRGAIPAGFANYSENYADGVLLRGGRISRTRDLPPGERAGYLVGGGVPHDTPDGDYRLCAKVDPGQKVKERAEDNNLTCVPLSIAGLRLAPLRPAVKDVSPLFGRKLAEPRVLGADRLRELPRPVQPPQPTGGGEATRSVLEDGSIEIRDPDGRIRRLRPDGMVETVMPDGTVIVPYAIQVQGADLPPLPEELSPWGSGLGEKLLAILGSILSEPELSAYRQTEEGKDYYALIDWRLRSIAFLTAME